jgi:hypothetical protein
MSKASVRWIAAVETGGGASEHRVSLDWRGVSFRSLRSASLREALTLSPVTREGGVFCLCWGESGSERLRVRRG